MELVTQWEIKCRLWQRNWRSWNNIN